MHFCGVIKTRRLLQGIDRIRFQTESLHSGLERAGAEGTLAADINHTKMLERLGHGEQALIAALFVNRAVCVQGLYWTAADTLLAAAVVIEQAPLLCRSRGNWQRGIDNQAAKPAGTAGVGDYHVMQAEASQPSDHCHALVRPITYQGNGIEVVGGWFGHRADSLLCQCLDQVCGDLADQRVGLDVRRRPLGSDVLPVCCVGVDDPTLEREKERNDRAGIRQQILGQPMPWHRAPQTLEARVIRGGKADKWLTVGGGCTGLGHQATDGTNYAVAQFNCVDFHVITAAYCIRLRH